MNYRCLKCGGKMQKGGPQMDNFIDAYTIQNLKPATSPQLDNSYRPNMNISTSSILNSPSAASPAGNGQMVQQNLSVTPTTTQRNYLYDSVRLRQGIAGLSEISGRVERHRQDQYDMQQQQLLGLMNPMPVQDFQPNPYNLYAKYGGRIKDHMYIGPAFSNDAKMRMDKYRELMGKTRVK